MKSLALFGERRCHNSNDVQFAALKGYWDQGHLQRLKNPPFQGMGSIKGERNGGTRVTIFLHGRTTSQDSGRRSFGGGVEGNIRGVYARGPSCAAVLRPPASSEIAEGKRRRADKGLCP